MAKKKTTRKKTTSRKKTTRKGAVQRRTAKTSGRRRSSLKAASVTELQAEIRRREGQLADLEAERAELMADLQAVERKIAALGGSLRGAGGTRRRARNTMNLADAMGRILKNRTLSVTDLAEAVQKAGYKTTSAGNFRTIVNQTLIKDPRFKRVSRGKYTVK